MKINAFQIKNYRSIVDSKKCFLSPDYITALIGQNESGKTSVLEALRSFYEGTITDDVLRSDLTFPEIICTFKINHGKELGDYIDINALPEDLRPILASKKEVSLKRKWYNSQNNDITLAESEVLDYYKCLENNQIECNNKIKDLIPELLKQTESASRDTEASENAVSLSRNEINAAYTRVEGLKKQIVKAKSPDAKISAQQELEMAIQQLNLAEADLKEKLACLNEIKTELQGAAEKLSTCKSFYEMLLHEQTLSADLKTIVSQISNTEFHLKTCKNDREIKSTIKRIEQLKEIQDNIRKDLKNAEEYIAINRKVADKILSGKRLKEAEMEAANEYHLEKSYATLAEVGKEVFNHVPLFEFFEDFSSLLPNKIDLDDLLNENIHAEGYKAARNFLYVAGLNADFFREDNHRILKQKIENLNSEITIDFQDYWRQSVGKDDKIRINFELEHYDHSQPEKSGKPYLEFWVKDKKERLYPKQRSRGVRWFLSFYLELKATAKEKTADRVMLIDEPGLSLHARAQEDVLKVFEDLSENLQIIYCTHSPNLIDIKKLYRIIAVQRARESDEKSETIVHDARTLSEASSDTLSPIYALMGTRLNDRQFIFPNNNLLVEDSVTFHYLDVMSRLYNFDEPVHYIPSSGADLLPMMANILYGWKINFAVILMDNPINVQLKDFLNSTTFFADEVSPENKFILMQGYTSVEDLFSTIDFKRFVLKQRVGITIKNSEFIENNKLSRMILVSDFHTIIQSEGIQYKDFDEETRGNFEKLFSLIRNIIIKE